MKQVNLKSSLILLLTAAIWGSAFVAQSVGMDYVGPFTFNAVRFLIGGFVLLLYLLLTGRLKRKARSEYNCADTGTGDGRKGIADDRALLWGGISCGLCLFAAGNLQQIGIRYTSVGKAGFITAMYIVLVPLFGVFMHKKIGLRIWVSVALAAAGLYLLCMTEALSLGKGDTLVLLCAVVFALHILVIDYFSPKADGVKMSCIQFFVSGGLSLLPTFLLEHPKMSALMAAGAPILYAGVLSCGVAYTLQIVGQRDMDPTVASLIMSLESVIAVIAGWLILGQTFSGRELAGCVLMFGAIILAQLPQRNNG